MRRIVCVLGLLLLSSCEPHVMDGGPIAREMRRRIVQEINESEHRGRRFYYGPARRVVIQPYECQELGPVNAYYRMKIAEEGWENMGLVAPWKAFGNDD